MKSFKSLLIGDRLSSRIINAALKEKMKVITYQKIDSTNSQAKIKIEAGIALPALLVAKRQTAGRGRRGKQFYSKGGGLYMTLAFSADQGSAEGLTALAAVAVAEAIEAATGKTVGIKWVNDIFIDDKKVCGILCERVTDRLSAKPKGVIIGIGININVKNFPKELENIAGNIGPLGISKNLLAADIANRITSLLKTGDYMDLYRQKSIVLGREISFTQNGESHKAVALKIDDNGSLVVQISDTATMTLTSGEVSIKVNNLMN